MLCVFGAVPLKFKIRSPKGKSQFQPSLAGKIHLAIDNDNDNDNVVSDDVNDGPKPPRKYGKRTVNRAPQAHA